MLLPRRRVFDARPVYVRFVMDSVALGQVFIPVLLFSPVGINPPTLRNHHLHAAFTRSLRILAQTALCLQPESDHAV